MDADGDGVFEMAVAGSDMNGNGRVYVFDVDGSVASPTSRMDWPKIRQNVLNHGRYLGIDPADVADGTDLRLLPFRVAPNPVFADGRITLRPPEGQAGSVTICDPTGRVLGRRTFAGGAILPVRELLGDNATRGVYFIRWQPSGEGRARQSRIVVSGE